MTNIATKNGSLIVKDGLLAETCGCCGWYCCADPACASDTIASVSATVTIPEYLRHTYFDQYSPWSLKQYLSYAVPGSSLSGTYTLNRVGTTNQWTKSASGCRDVSIEFNVVTPTSPAVPVTANGTVRFRTFASYSEWDEQYKTASQISCTDVTTGSRSTPGVPGTLKFELSLENSISAYATGGLCGLIPSTLDGTYPISFPNTSAYGFDTKPLGTLTTIQSVGDDGPSGRLQFAVTFK